MELARQEFKRILLIKPSSLGDVIHALPVLHGLRRRYPRAHLAWLVSVTCRGLIDVHPEIDEIVPFDRRYYGRMLRSPAAAAAFFGFVRALRARRFDCVIDLQGLFRSGFLTRATGAGVRIGFANAREGAPLAYTHRIPAGPPDEHAVDRNYRVAAMLGFADVPIAFPLHVQPAARKHVASLLAASDVNPAGPYAVLTPGARWETKLWPAAKMAEMADELYRRHDLHVVVAGAPDEMAICAAVERAATRPVANVCGKTGLAELVALIDGAALLVSNDSGPMHIGAALGRPVVGLFGPTNPDRTGPYSPTARVVQRGLDCSPCYLKKVSLCPHDHACLRGLEPEVVAQVVASMLAPVEEAPQRCS